MPQTSPIPLRMRRGARAPSAKKNRLPIAARLITGRLFMTRRACGFRGRERLNKIAPDRYGIHDRTANGWPHSWNACLARKNISCPFRQPGRAVYLYGAGRAETTAAPPPRGTDHERNGARCAQAGAAATNLGMGCSARLGLRRSTWSLSS